MSGDKTDLCNRMDYKDTFLTQIMHIQEVDLFVSENRTRNLKIASPKRKRYTNSLLILSFRSSIGGKANARCSDVSCDC